VRSVVYVVIVAVWVVALAYSIRAHLGEREIERPTPAVVAKEPRDVEQVDAVVAKEPRDVEQVG
jgi:hypothetical protein